jgi:hypothetical protein
MKFLSTLSFLAFAAILLPVPQSLAMDSLRVLSPLSTIPSSSEYLVWLSTNPGSDFQSAHVHCSESGTPDAVEKTAFNYLPHLQGWRQSFVNFEFKEVAVWAKVAKPGGDVPDFIVRPKKKGVEITYAYEAGRRIALFKFQAPIDAYQASAYVSVIPYVDRKEDIANVLHLFGNPFFNLPTDNLRFIEAGEDIPKSNDLKKGQTLVFKPGMHDLGINYRIANGVTYFLQNGAYVKGTIRNKQSFFGTKITGLGILSGSHIKSYDGGPEVKLEHATFRSYNCNNNIVEGITIEDPPFRAITLGSIPKDVDKKNLIRNVKILTWRPEASGIHVLVRGQVDDCFIRSQGVALDMLRNFGVQYHRLVLWTDNGSPSIQFPTNAEGHDIRVVDCDILYCRSPTSNPLGSVFVKTGLKSGIMVQNITLKDIRVEDPQPSNAIFHLALDGSIEHTGEDFGFQNIRFENIMVAADGKLPNSIIGYRNDPAFMPRNIQFSCVELAGRQLNNLEGWSLVRFDTNEAHFFSCEGEETHSK